MRIWNIILIQYFPFIGAAWLYLKLAMLDMEITLEQVALIASVCGVVAALASFTYSLFLSYFSLYRAFFSFSMVNVLALFGMYIAVSMVWLDWLLIIAVMGIAIALGLSSGVLFAVIMADTRSCCCECIDILLDETRRGREMKNTKQKSTAKQP